MGAGHRSSPRDENSSPELHNAARNSSASDDSTARVWDLEDPGTPVVLQGHSGDAVLSAAFSPDGRRVVTASDDNTSRVWDLEDPEYPVVLRGHSASVLSAAFSPDGRRVVTASRDNTVRVWDLDFDKLTKSLRSRTRECLLPVERMRYLAESEPEAKRRHEECRNQYWR